VNKIVWWLWIFIFCYLCTTNSTLQFVDYKAGIYIAQIIEGKNFLPLSPSHSRYKIETIKEQANLN